MCMRVVGEQCWQELVKMHTLCFSFTCVSVCHTVCVESTLIGVMRRIGLDWKCAGMPRLRQCMTHNLQRCGQSRMELKRHACDRQRYGSAAGGALPPAAHGFFPVTRSGLHWFATSLLVGFAHVRTCFPCHRSQFIKCPHTLHPLYSACLRVL